jgi:hypothetical protein
MTNASFAGRVETEATMVAVPGLDFESPFLSNELFARESNAGSEARTGRLASQSPFLSEAGFASADAFQG